MLNKIKSDINKLKPIFKLGFISEMELRKRQGRLSIFY